MFRNCYRELSSFPQTLVEERNLREKINLDKDGVHSNIET